MRLEIRLVTDKTWASAAIRYLSWSPWSHVDVVMLDGRLVGAHLQDGVQIRPATYGAFTAAKRKYIEVTGTQCRLAMNFALSQVGKPYDKTGIANFFLHRQRDWREDDSWWCSEYAAAVFEAGGVQLFSPDVPMTEITPRDIDMSPVLLTS